MDRESLIQAAFSGDVGYLNRAKDLNPTKFQELARSTYKEVDSGEDEIPYSGNILHLALWREKFDFFKEAINILNKEVTYQLLCQLNESEWTPLHLAVLFTTNCLELVRLIINFFRLNYELEKPWLTLGDTICTPLLMLLGRNRINEEDEVCALELLSYDFELQCSMVTGFGVSPLFLAVQHGFNQVAEKILSASVHYSVSGEFGSTPLHFAPKCSEKVLRLLLDKHPDHIDKVDGIRGCNVLHRWAELKEIWQFNLILDGAIAIDSVKIFNDFIFAKDKFNCETPIHIAARTNNANTGRAIVSGYLEMRERGQIVSPDSPPWKIRNKNGDTPLNVAICKKNPELALYLLSIDPALCQTLNHRGESPLLNSIANGDSCKEVVKIILRMKSRPEYTDLRRNDGTTVLHLLRFCPEDLGCELIGKFWWLMNLLDDQRKSALDYAIADDVQWLVNLLRNPSLIQKEPFDWITACQSDQSWVATAFVDTCPDLYKVCREQQDTPLHHIKFGTYQEYLNFLNLEPIAELKNVTNSEGATPLYRALERKDILLAKALLNDERVERNIKDMDLLSNLCEENSEWATMCQEINVNPLLRTSYVRTRTNLDQMRNTLSVVAALLATITFAAGFTLPGGLDSDNGSAVLAKKPSFIVFLLADAYAMCTSMLVLFCLIWSMVTTNNDMAYLLVDRSVLVLLQSLYGTLVAFMTGIYTVIEHNTLWVAIVIIVMCSLIGISSNRSVLHIILAKFIPVANQDKKDQSQSLIENPEGTNATQRGNQSGDQLALLEEGEASTSRKQGSLKAE